MEEYGGVPKSRGGLSTNTKVRMVEDIVVPLVLYKWESWTLERVQRFNMKRSRTSLGVNTGMKVEIL